MGACRSWIQFKCGNGSIVIWESDETLVPHLTVRQVEDMAECVANAAFSEADQMQKRIDDLVKKNFELGMKNNLLEDKVKSLENALNNVR